MKKKKEEKTNVKGSGKNLRNTFQKKSYLIPPPHRRSGRIVFISMKHVKIHKMNDYSRKLKNKPWNKKQQISP
jgi:predicted transcriptional regulator with HTH domain